MSEPTTPSTPPPRGAVGPPRGHAENQTVVLDDLRTESRRTVSPQPVHVSTHAGRWFAAEIDEWIATRPRAGTRRPKR